MKHRRCDAEIGEFSRATGPAKARPEKARPRRRGQRRRGQRRGNPVFIYVNIYSFIPKISKPWRAIDAGGSTKDVP